MTEQNYLVVQNNVVSNLVIWNGDTSQWQPPSDAIMLIQAETPAMVWSIPTATNPSILEEVMGVGTVGFTWGGTKVITNLPEPIYVPPVTS